MNPDLLNSILEFVASAFILNHCLVLYKDKSVKGVSTVSTIYFLGCGIWNLYYSSNLNQKYTLIACVLTTLFSVLRVGMMVYYRRKEHENQA